MHWTVSVYCWTTTTYKLPVLLEHGIILILENKPWLKGKHNDIVIKVAKKCPRSLMSTINPGVDDKTETSCPGGGWDHTDTGGLRWGMRDRTTMPLLFGWVCWLELSNRNVIGTSDKALFVLLTVAMVTKCISVGFGIDTASITITLLLHRFSIM